MRIKRKQNVSVIVNLQNIIIDLCHPFFKLILKMNNRLYLKAYVVLSFLLNKITMFSNTDFNKSLSVCEIV